MVVEPNYCLCYLVVHGYFKSCWRLQHFNHTARVRADRPLKITRYTIVDLLVLAALIASVVCFEASPIGFGNFTQFGVREQHRNLQVGGLALVLCTLLVRFRSRWNQRGFSDTLRAFSLLVICVVFLQFLVVSILSVVNI